VRGCYLATRRIIVCAEVRSRAAPPRGFEKDGQVRLSALVDDRLRSLDHHLHLQRPRVESARLFKLVEETRERGDLFGDCDFGKRDDEVTGQRAARLFQKRREEDVERASRARVQLFREGLDAYADEGR